MGGTRPNQPLPFSGRKQLRDTGIERRPVGVARPAAVRLALRHQAGNLGPALETRIDQAEICQALDRCAIIGEMLAIAAAPGFPK